MRLILAPMQGVVDHSMREMLTRIGGYDRCVTEFIRVTHSLLPEKVFFRYCPVTASMHASKLAVTWQERVECIVDDKLAVKRLRFTDVVQDKADEVDAQDAAEQFDIDFAIMTLELSAFIKALMEAFGGEESGRSSTDEKNAA